MSKLTTSVLLALVAAAIPGMARADTHTWVGGDPGGPWWNLPGNWSPAEVPGADDAVRIAAGADSSIIHYYNIEVPCPVLYALDLDSVGGELTLDIGNNGALNHALTVTFETVGVNGSASVAQSAGTHSVYLISLADTTEATATYHLSGGTFSADQDQYIGYAGVATFVQSGGVNNNSARMTSGICIGALSTGEGEYQLKGGLLNTVNVAAGWDGAGTLTQTGGLHHNVLGVFLGVNPGSIGGYSLSGDATLSSYRQVQVGLEGVGMFAQTGGANINHMALELGLVTTGTGTYTLSDGTLTVQAGEAQPRGVVRVGGAGAGTFLQSGGVFTISSYYEYETLVLGHGATGSGYYSLSGGTLWTNRDQYVGYDGAGRFEQSGGYNTATGTLVIAANPGSSGMYRKTAGTLVASNVINNGTFVSSGGRLEVSGTFTNTGAATIGGEQHWGDGAVFDNAGVATFTSDAGTDGRCLVVNAAGSSLTFGSAQHLRALHLGGEVNVAVDPGGAKRIVIDDFSISPSSKLNLNDNALIVDYTTASPFETIRTDVTDGRIYSAMSDGATRGLGYADNVVLGATDVNGEPVDPTSVIVKFTYLGDADLNGKVDVADLGRLASSWQTSAPWTGGDFDYNGFVDVNDLGLLASNWQAGVGAVQPTAGAWAFAEALGLGSVNVPEPVCIAALALLAFVAQHFGRR